MESQVTYLELSEGDVGAHKFYEVTVVGSEIKIRYGRIGTAGQEQIKTYPSPEKAQAEATKKIQEKQHKGYEPAVMGVRSKRSVTQRSVSSTPSQAQRAPLLWRFPSHQAAFGLFVDDHTCWLGNQKGEVFVLSHQGEMLNRFQLPEGVKCIVADDVWIYAGCDDGRVYDLSGKLPHVAYDIDDSIDIYWLDIYDGTLGIADANGALVKVEPMGEGEWTRLSQGRCGWMVRCDRDCLYHGHSGGVTCYDRWDGRQRWHQPTTGAVLFGWQEESVIYAGTTGHTLVSFTKEGQPSHTYTCDASVYSCATSEGGKYVFAGDNASSIYCFDRRGKRLWKLGTGCGSALSMQFHQAHLYFVTTDGSLACMDVSSKAIAAAQRGNCPPVQDITPTPLTAVTVATPLETTSHQQDGVLVECVPVGNQLRIQILSPGYHHDWFVQFPRNLRQAGAKYWVQDIREAARGGFYRAYGDIKRWEG